MTDADLSLAKPFSESPVTWTCNAVRYSASDRCRNSHSRLRSFVMSLTVIKPKASARSYKRPFPLFITEYISRNHSKEEWFDQLTKSTKPIRPTSTNQTDFKTPNQLQDSV